MPSATCWPAARPAPPPWPTSSPSPGPLSDPALCPRRVERLEIACPPPGESSNGEPLWALLEPCSQRERLHRIEHQPRFHDRALFDHLLELARGASWHDPHGACDRAELALHLSGSLPLPAHAPRGLHNDLCAAAVTCLAEASRRAGRLRRAETALTVALLLLEQGTGD
ncbi:MAG: hypothetical protein M3O15_10515, partial [Acidobacteriota bacterium]|nr:hypothetical protein [Acidobacteriota bacterium]